MASSNVPKFGNWEAEENVSYTAYFDKARKVQAPGSIITNPNDPEYKNPDPQSQPPSRTKPEQDDQVRRSSEQVRNVSYEKSPLHKNSSDGTGRSKPKSNLRAADESPERATVVPKFGDWDENNPASADGYTHIFNKVREERSSGPNMTGSSRTSTNSTSRNQSNTSKCCCFSFGGK